MAKRTLLERQLLEKAASYLPGEYGINGLCVGVPVRLGAGSMEQVIQISLTNDEKAALQRSADSVRELVNVMHKARAGSAS